jgi:hypothetical protein
MHTSPTAQGSGSISMTRQAFRFIAQQAHSDAAILIGLPLLITVGAILGVINLLALIHLVAVLIGG